MDAGHKLSCFNDPNTCFFTDLRGYVEEVLLASRKTKFYCAVTLGLPLLGIFHVWSGLLNFVAQMMGTVLAAVILTLLYSEEKGFMHDLGCNGVGVGWSCGNALVGEFMFIFLLVFTVFQTAVNSAFDHSSTASFALVWPCSWPRLPCKACFDHKAPRSVSCAVRYGMVSLMMSSFAVENNAFLNTLGQSTAKAGFTVCTMR